MCLPVSPRVPSYFVTKTWRTPLIWGGVDKLRSGLGVASCVQYSAIRGRLRGKCRDSLCPRGTQLSLPSNLAMFAGFCGQKKRPLTLRRSLGATSERLSDGWPANMNRRSWSYWPSFTKCSSDSSLAESRYSQSRGRSRVRLGASAVELRPAGSIGRIARPRAIGLTFGIVARRDLRWGSASREHQASKYDYARSAHKTPPKRAKA